MTMTMTMTPPLIVTVFALSLASSMCGMHDIGNRISTVARADAFVIAPSSSTATAAGRGRGGNSASRGERGGDRASSSVVDVARRAATSTSSTSSAMETTTTIAPTRTTTAARSSVRPPIGRRMDVNESYPGLRLVHADPDVYVIENFLNDDACDDMMRRAFAGGNMARSPVAYAGWTSDLKELLGLAASGPVSWIALFGAWYESTYVNVDDASVISLVFHALRNYVATFVVASIAILSFLRRRADGLVELRTSTSTTLVDLSQYGAREFVSRASMLFDVPPHSSRATSSSTSAMPASYFEAPTVIRYETGQSLAPHFDANDSAEFEDANRGGQTLSTLIVYLNDVSEGGTTRFTKLTTSSSGGTPVPLEITPRRGDALLFFPADAHGNFDDRTEHEGRPALDEKWIARIWRHEHRVPPPFGLSDSSMTNHL
jgi:hypothetical protein